MFSIDPTSLSASDIAVLAITIICRPVRGTIETVVEHTAEDTKTEDGETVRVTRRAFPRRVACPYAAAEAQYRATLVRHPDATVELVYA